MRGIHAGPALTAAMGQESSSSLDGDGDGAAESTDEISYDPLGNSIRYRLDSNADGTPDQIWTSAYDARGKQDHPGAPSGPDAC